jgi:hypothetical protein
MGLAKTWWDGKMGFEGGGGDDGARTVGSRGVTATGLKGGGGEDGACAVGALSQWRLGFN